MPNAAITAATRSAPIRWTAGTRPVSFAVDRRGRERCRAWVIAELREGVGSRAGRTPAVPLYPLYGAQHSSVRPFLVPPPVGEWSLLAGGNPSVTTKGLAAGAGRREAQQATHRPTGRGRGHLAPGRCCRPSTARCPGRQALRSR